MGKGLKRKEELVKLIEGLHNNSEELNVIYYFVNFYLEISKKEE